MLSHAVTDKQIARVVSRATGIPVDSLLLGEHAKLLHMDKVIIISSCDNCYFFHLPSPRN